MNTFYYLFWPRPPQVGYDNPKLQALLAIVLLLILLAFVLKRWRKKLQNQQTKKLSRNWSRACIWFGVIGLILAVSRAEDISYLSMRFLWVLWTLVLMLYCGIQIRTFRARHYEVMPKQIHVDPRSKYLPKKKK